jgi:hypothetical protein
MYWASRRSIATQRKLRKTSLLGFEELLENLLRVAIQLAARDHQITSRLSGFFEPLLVNVRAASDNRGLCSLSP